MNGIERAEIWYEARVLPMLKKQFPELLPRIAIGIAGRGSECFGFDDEISLDHDCGTGVSLWLNDEDEINHGFALMRAYNALHKEDFPEKTASSSLGFQEHGVCRISDFYRRHLGFPRAPESWQEWYFTPDCAFAEAVNGKIFRDDAGEFSRIRQQIKTAMPSDVWKKKIATCAIMMAQSGQYNFCRCLKHGETGAAMLALAEFVRHAITMLFYLNHSFSPYYKWCFKAAAQLPEAGMIAGELENLLVENSPPADKIAKIEKICAEFVALLNAGNLSRYPDNYLEPHAFEIVASISSAEIRNMHIMQ